MKRFILLLLVVCISCNEKENNEVLWDPPILQEKHGLYIVKYKETGILKRTEIYNQGVLNGESKEYYRNGNLKWIKDFDNGLISGTYLFYNENGDLKIEKELVKFYGPDTPYCSTTKVYNDYGDIIMDSSFYYQFINEKRVYKLGESSTLKVKLFGSYFKDRMHISTAEFDAEFNILDNHQRYFRNDDYVCEIPIPTDSTGNNKLKFIINDYKFTDLIDSLVDVKQILVNFEYLVE